MEGSGNRGEHGPRLTTPTKGRVHSGPRAGQEGPRAHQVPPLLLAQGTLSLYLHAWLLPWAHAQVVPTSALRHPRGSGCAPNRQGDAARGPEPGRSQWPLGSPTPVFQAEGPPNTIRQRALPFKQPKQQALNTRPRPSTWPGPREVAPTPHSPSDHRPALVGGLRGHAHHSFQGMRLWHRDSEERGPNPGELPGGRTHLQTPDGAGRWAGPGGRGRHGS